jgi:hypothetical protein
VGIDSPVQNGPFRRKQEKITKKERDNLEVFQHFFSLSAAAAAAADVGI